jgi:hypothetical protein
MPLERLGSDRHPEASAVINQLRIHAYKGGVFELFYCATNEARKMKEFLISSGFVITHTEVI